MDTRIRSLNKAVKEHDRFLFCKRDGDNVNVYREGSTWFDYDLGEFRLLYSVSSPKLVCSLTDNWNITGSPVEWGIEPVVQRLKSIDNWGDFNKVKDLKKNYDKELDEKDHARRSRDEDFLREFRPQFKKAFNDVNTSNMDKKLDNRRRRENASRK